MKIAIVYDWIDKWGGVERVLLTLHEIFPDADFYTSYYDSKEAPWAKNFKIKTSFIQRLPNFIKRNRVLSLPFYTFAFESFNFTEYDLVISVSSSFAKSVITKPGTRHICYLLTPTRYFWWDTYRWTQPFLKYYREWDKVAAQRPDKIISISKTVQKRCKKYYGRESEVIYPPFDSAYWSRIKSQIPHFAKASRGKPNSKFYLVVSRLEPYKKVDLAIKVFNKLPLDNLIIVGKGTQESKLKRLAAHNIIFMKDLTDTELAQLYSSAKALIMPQEEDFGYIALEAQLFGCPIIAFHKGGATETIIEGKSGIFFEKQTEKDIVEAVQRCDKIKSYEGSDFRRWSRNTFVATFQKKISQAV